MSPERDYLYDVSHSRQAGSLFRACSAHVLFPRKNVVVLIRESRLARLPRSRLEQPGYQQAGQSAFSWKQNERKQCMNRAKPAKRACLVYRAGSPHINVPNKNTTSLRQMSKMEQ